MLRGIEKYIILWAVPLNNKLILRMTVSESVFLVLSDLKYVGIFDYIEDTVRIQAIYTRIVYFLKSV